MLYWVHNEIAPSTRFCQAGKGGDFRRKYYPSLDGTERHTALAEGKATRLSLLPHGECGVWGNAPRVKFRDGVRPPFSKGEEDWGLQDEEMNVEYEVASNNTLFFDRYIGSRRHAPRVPKCDPETGEVIEKKES